MRISACSSDVCSSDLGVLDRGCTAVAVLRTGSLLGIDDAGDPGLYGHMLRLGDPCAGLALLVDRVAAVRRVPPGDHRQIGPDETFRGCVVGEIAGTQGDAPLLPVARLPHAGARKRLQASRRLDGSTERRYRDKGEKK